jgi:hypothetical protein
MRALILALAVAGGMVAMAAPSPALAWYDSWGRWHPNHYRPHYPPPRVYSYAPPRPYYRPYYAPPRVYYRAY